MRVWVTTVHPPGCISDILGVHAGPEAALAKLRLRYRDVRQCGADSAECRCDFERRLPDLHGTAEEPAAPGGTLAAADLCARRLVWTVHQVSLE